MSGNITSDALAQIPKKISLHSQLPNFRDIPPNQKTILFISKLRQCNKLVRVDDQDLRKLKHLVLYQLLEYINICNNQFPLEAIPDFFNTVSINIFRQAQKPQAEDEDVYDPEEDEPTVDPSWYHLQFVYEMLLRFVYSAQTQNPEYQKLVKKYIDCDFVIRLMQLFNQSDPRERDYVKTILHRIYANIMSLRAYIRLALKSELQTYYCTKQQHSGICDILEVLGSIINGYAVPLKLEHIQFLQQCLVPLHRVQYIKQILPQLSYCVSKFIEKDPKLSSYIIQQILLFYPRLNSHKEVSILTEIEELLELVPPECLIMGRDEKLWPEQVKNPLFVYDLLFKTIAQAMCSLHFQVAEKAINMISNQKFLLHVQNAFQKWNELYNKSGSVSHIIMEDEEFKEPNESASAKPLSFTKECVSQQENPLFILGMSLRSNQQAHWNSNIRFASDQTLKQLSTISPSEIDNIDQKIINELVYREFHRQAKESTGQELITMALANVAKFGDYFSMYDTKGQHANFVPGYQCEVIQKDKIMSAAAPEDPLFCRAEEMAIKNFNITPETIVGALDGVMLELSLSRPDQQIDGQTEATVADKLVQKGFDLQDEALRDRIMQAAVDNLVAAGLVQLQKADLQAVKLLSVQTKMPTKRLTSRRASAGVPQNLGIRRKSVTPMTAQQIQARAELQSFEKHDVK